MLRKRRLEWIKQQTIRKEKTFEKLSTITGDSFYIRFPFIRRNPHAPHTFFIKTKRANFAGNLIWKSAIWRVNFGNYSAFRGPNSTKLWKFARQRPNILANIALIFKKNYVSHSNLYMPLPSNSQFSNIWTSAFLKLLNSTI